MLTAAVDPDTAEPAAAEPGADTVDRAAVEPSELVSRYRQVRDFTEQLCEPLEIEDYVVQSMPDASPAKWHLAHTTWFFETFLLERFDGYEPFDPSFNFLFNSYYNSVGKQYFRPDRGKISRPTVAQVHDYRRRVDDAMVELIQGLEPPLADELLPLLEVGLNHEQQHQELLLTDLKHMFSCNPLFPVYRPAPAVDGNSGGEAPLAPAGWRAFDEGLHEIGQDVRPNGPFAYDNEGPRHRVFVEAFELSTRLVTCGDYLEFMADGGYRDPAHWLSDGWATVQAEGWRSPLYWLAEDDGSWSMFTLAGKRPVDPKEPVCHLSFFEADAFARWAGARLPTEAEWEVAAEQVLAGDRLAEARDRANLVESGHVHPVPWTPDRADDMQLLGDVWEWTRSAYAPYPGYAPPAGALGEYNAKFMNNQIVLRGGSCATSRTHIRMSYRNFFPSDVRWQFTGLRLARRRQ